jgi:UDP-GlcNAc:undecaprenyl-phosphate GlcNAc-1-phosphate transferase
MAPAVDILVAPVAAFLIALLLSVWIIPGMMRLAPRIGMVDKPDPRKVHRKPTPRVGGIGIAGGALIAILLLAPHSSFMLAYVSGSLILALFGAWDDIHELGHYPKFVGQIAAAALVVWYGGVWIQSFPFLANPLPAWVGKPFTLVAIVGVINAINHADGLDGLAGGESLLSMGALVCLAYLSGSARLLILTAAVAGGLLGFIRYNTWPARVFMGDLGSQFLGFSVGVFAIALTQLENPTCSKSLAILLVGLPIVDILAVLFQRIRGGMNWFRATRNHIHHRLLDLNFDHYQAVLVIYTVQGLLTFVALFVAYESDVLILSIYTVVCSSVFAGLILAERLHWRRDNTHVSLPMRLAALIGEQSPLGRAPLLFIQITIPTYLLLVSTRLSHDQAITPVGVYAPILIVLLAALVTIGIDRSPAFYRLALYGSIGILAYCLYSEPEAFDAAIGMVNLIYLLALGAAVSLAAALTRRDEFAVTNLDFLIVGSLISAALFSHEIVGASNFWTVAIATTVLLYGCELIIMRGGVLWNRILGTSAVGALGIIVGKIFL